MANTYTGSDAGQAGLNITEVDGSPNVSGVSKIIVSNGTLTDDGAGSVTITTGGGGGGTVTSVSVSGGFTGLTVTGSPITTSGTITIAGTLAIANGGTGATTDSTARAALGAAASGDNSDITKLAGLTTALSPAQGGTGATTLTDGGILIGSGLGAVTVTSQPTNGQLLIGSDGLDPVLQSLSGGSGISINNGAGSIIIGSQWPVTPLGPAAGGIAGFINPPPDDANYIADGWIQIETDLGPRFVPAWRQE